MTIRNNAMGIRHCPNLIIRFQASRIRRHLHIKNGDGIHLTYQGMYLAEGEAMMDVFLYSDDKLKGCKTGYPEFVMIDASGDDVRFSTIEETEYFMRYKLERRKNTDEREYSI